MNPEKLSEANQASEKPVAVFEDGRFQLFDIDDLPEEERNAVYNAIVAYKKSDNHEFRAGAVAVAENGDIAVRHNEVGGPDGHAEMLAVGSLYRTVAPGQFVLKIVALAGTYPHEELVRVKRYGPNVKLQDIDVHTICGRCRKFLNDYSIGNAMDEKGVSDPQKDVTILMVTGSNQVLRSSLRALYPLPYTPSQVPLKPLEQSIRRSPDTYGQKGSNGNGNGDKINS